MSFSGNNLHPVFLYFQSNQLEESYSDWSLGKNKKALAQGFILSALSFCSIFFTDWMMLGRMEMPLLLIRLIVFPGTNLLLFLVLKFGNIKNRFRLDILGVAFILLSQLWQFWVVMLYPDLGNLYWLIMIMLSFLGTITFTSLNFRFLFPTILVVLFGFLLKIYLVDDLSVAQLSFQTLVGVMFTSIGLTSGYLIERAARVDFLSKMDIEKKHLELVSKNKELEQFAYIASHDLQEPLRSVTSFSQLLNEDYRGQIDEEGGQYIDFLLEASTRMRNLIKGLLDYSRLGREANSVSVSVPKMLSEIQQDLSVAISECNAMITQGSLPTLNVYETEFRQLLQNLLSNALKFRRADVAPAIHFSAVRKGSSWEFAVKDNGIGIAKEHQEKIFLIFQRLHNRSQYEGTGIGLANCRKIVEFHGGTIRVESEDHHGSTFYFTIPIK